MRNRLVFQSMISQNPCYKIYRSRLEIKMYHMISAIFGYLVGSINPAYLIAKYKGFDIRKRGSGNAGASNVVITMGNKAGIITAVFDIFKAFISFRLMAYLFPQAVLAGEAAGAGCIIGHIFPIFMGFRGGKGLATLGGVVLAFDPRVFLILLICEAILVLIVDYICIVPVTASIIFPFMYFRVTDNALGAAIFSLVATVICFKHTENFKRIRSGTEAHFSFLWKKDEEIARLQKNNSNED